MEDIRPNWDEVRMSMCRCLSARSTCWKKRTAAIIVDKHRRIVSEGYNGTLSGDRHCIQIGPRDRMEHREWSAVHEVHAELNAIIMAAGHKGIPPGSTMYTILSPCIKCAQAICAVKIACVVYCEIYREDGLQFLKDHGVLVRQI
jgi:dCMP deaminase